MRNPPLFPQKLSLNTSLASQGALQGVPEKITSQVLLYISISKKGTKKIIVWPEGAKNPDRVEYRTASEQYLVAEICRVEVTEPRNEKILVKNIYFVSLQQCVVDPFVSNVKRKHYFYLYSTVHIHKSIMYCKN